MTSAAGYHVCFVCTGNICRSPMAAIVFGEHLRREGLADRVRVSSAGTGSWHVGQPADDRVERVLTAGGYPIEHVAATVSPEHLSADLVLAMDSGHLRALRQLIARHGGDPSRLRMFRSFDPAAGTDLDVADPYYGDRAGFATTLELVEAAMPGLLAHVREHVAS